MGERLVDARELARHLGVSIDSVYRLASRGKIPSYRTGTSPKAHRRFQISDVEDALREDSQR